MPEFPDNLHAIRELVVSQFRLDIDGTHGMPHWRRVYRNGLLICEADPSVDRDVIAAFALLHDSQRENEYDDPMHGVRGSRFANELLVQGHMPWLDKERRTWLRAAICSHPLGGSSVCSTIQACFDADRLDLGRIGIKPHPKFLGSVYAHNPGVIERHWEMAWEEEAAV